MTDDAKNIPVAGKPSGSLTDMVDEVKDLSWRQAMPGATLLRMLVVVGLVVAMNFRQFPYMFRLWVDDPNWSHGFMIPLFSLYLLYSRRDELLRIHRKVCPWALVLVLVAAVLQVAAYQIQNPWSCQVGMLLLILSLVFYLGGWQAIKIIWLPVMFLSFAMPIPESYYGKIALALQNVAATGSGIMLRMFGANVVVTASNLNVQDFSGTWLSLTVAEACSGMRLLMAFVALSVAMAYLGDRPLWQRIILVAMGIPVAILCNVLRVVITSAMFIWEKPALGKDFMHEFTGMLMLIPAFILLWLLGKILNAVYMADEDPEEDASGGPETVEEKA